MATPTYIPLSTITLSSTASTVTFSSIPASYRDLVVVFSGTGSQSVAGYYVYLNNDTTDTNYSRVAMYANSGGASSFTSANPLWLEIGSAQSTNILHLMDYSASDKHTTALTRANISGTVTAAFAGRWANTAVVTSVSLTRYTFNAGTTVSLYGIAG